MEVEALVRGVAEVADHLATDHPDQVEDREVEAQEEIPITAINRQPADHIQPHLVVRGVPAVAEVAATTLATQPSSMTPSIRPLLRHGRCTIKYKRSKYLDGRTCRA